MALIERHIVDIPGNNASGEFPIIRYANSLLEQEDFDALFELNDVYVSFSISEKETDTQYYFSDTVRHTSLKTIVSGDSNPFDKDWHTGQLGLITEEKLIANAIFHEPPGKTEELISKNIKNLLKLVNPNFIDKPSIPIKIGFGIQSICCYKYFPTLHRLRREPSGIVRLNKRLAEEKPNSETF